jgi:hypothetical protein
VSRFTPLHPLRPAHRAPLRRSLPKGRPTDEPLVLLVSSLADQLCSDSQPRRPHARSTGPPRERRARPSGRGAPSFDEEHSKERSRPRVAARATVPFRRWAGAPRLGALGAGTATTAPYPRTPDTARRLLQSTRNPSTPAGDRHPAHAVVAHGAVAPFEACGRWVQPKPHPPAAPVLGARAWLHGGPERAGHGHPRRDPGSQRALERCCWPEPPRPPLLARANVRAVGEAGVPSDREETVPSLAPPAAP